MNFRAAKQSANTTNKNSANAANYNTKPQAGHQRTAREEKNSSTRGKNAKSASSRTAGDKQKHAITTKQSHQQPAHYGTPKPQNTANSIQTSCGQDAQHEHSNSNTRTHNVNLQLRADRQKHEMSPNLTQLNETNYTTTTDKVTVASKHEDENAN